MNNITPTLTKLLTQLCPNGVEFKELGDIAEILNGYAFQSGKYVGEGIRVIRISDVQKGKMSDKDMKYYPAELEKEIERYLLRENDLVMSLTGNVGRVAMLSESNLPAGLNQRVACIRTKGEILTRFLFHFFDQDSFEKEAMSNATGGGQKNMSTTWLGKYQIPIPPLSIQEEIVTILDTFTLLEAELEAELEARKSQYEYYRDDLLSFGDDEVEWKSLKELMKRNKGTKITASQMKELNKENGPVKIFAGGKTFAMVNFEDIPKKDIIEVPSIIVKSRGIIEFEYYNKSFSHKNEFWSYYSDNEKINTKYVFYYLKINEVYFQNIANRMQMPQISLPDTDKFKIPIPTLQKQQEIVTILDKFDALVNDISIGLPAELQARRQQYEYYRNKLLTFKPMVNR